MNPISFPGLGINNITINPTAFTIFGHPIAWYGIIIACGLLTALLYGMVRAKFFGISVDDLSDIVIFAIIFGIIGARLYFVLFPYSGTTTNEYLSNPITILYIWNGGLAIYGGIIAAFITGFVVAKIKKISVGAVFDIASLGFLIGQAIGRWGNFINQEAYGSSTNLPWRMVVNDQPVHPCFLYESLWCVIGFIILHIYSKRRKFNGEIFLMYISWYSFGRFFIEGLRTDSLMLGNLKISQLVAAILFISAVTLLVYKRINLKKAITEQNAEYDPLFEETSKAVEKETADEMQRYEIDAGDASVSADAEDAGDVGTEDTGRQDLDSRGSFSEESAEETESADKTDAEGNTENE